MDPYLLLAIIFLFLLLVFVILYATLRIRFNKQIERRAMEAFKGWMDATLEGERQKIKESIEKEYNLILEKWKSEYSEKIRKDAIQKSQSVLKGKVTEQIVPYFPDFPYDPRDVRFIGSPVDLIVFSGLREKNFVEEIVFLEIKTGRGKQSEVEKKVEEAIKNGRISYKVINISRETL